MSKMFVGGCWYFLEKCWKTGGKRTRCPRQPIVDMDVDCRRPRHDENYSSLFVENSHPETLHRDMCIACSGSSAFWNIKFRVIPSVFTIWVSAIEQASHTHKLFTVWVSATKQASHTHKLFTAWVSEAKQASHTLKLSLTWVSATK